MRSDFAIFILTHGRAGNVETFETLRRSGYTGKIYLVIDDEDAQGDEYRRRYGDRVLVFSKKEMEGTFDAGDNHDRRNVIIYARNVCFRLAREVGVRYFMELDDDYTGFLYTFTGGMRSKRVSIRKTFDGMIDALLDFFVRVPNLLTIATAQGGDFIGGEKAEVRLKRKAMNSFLCDVERPFSFVGRVNEDVCTYVLSAIRGGLMFTTTAVQLNQIQTQQNAGGMTTEYRESGTYIKSFYTVMMAPSCVRISDMGRYDRRIHHKIRWANAAPKILREDVSRRDLPPA